MDTQHAAEPGSKLALQCTDTSPQHWLAVSVCTYQLGTQHEAEVGSVLQRQAADEGGAVHGILRSHDAAGQQAVTDESRNGLAVVGVCQQVVLPLPEEVHALPAPLLHLGLLPLQQPHLVLCTGQTCIQMTCT